MKPITTAIGEVHPDVAERLEQLISNNKNFGIVGTTTRDVNKFLESIRQYKPELILLSKDMRDPKNPKLDGYEICRQILVESPLSVVVITSPYEDINDLRKFMKVGARDFISLPEFDSRLVINCIETVTDLRKYDFSINDKNGKVISFFSPKGGVGKTTMALNVAYEMKKKIKDMKTNESVLVIDFSLQFGDIAYLCGEKPNRTLADLCELRDIDKDAFEGHTRHSEHGDFHILSAPRKAESYFNINPDNLNKIIPIAKKMFDYIIIDTNTGLTRETSIAIDNSDFCFLVTNNQLVSLKNTNSMLELLHESNVFEKENERVFVLINELDKSGIQPNDITSRLKCKMIGYISKNDKIVVDSQNMSKFISEYNANSEISKEFRKLSSNIYSLLQPEKKQRFEDFTEVKKKSFITKLFTK